ncbi:hypothetical protein [Halobaculum rubrum]|uniref:hypothetical protein n=1 Tax=Halobaculum rubrum TaxID=2872158 RepID=UPI001CA4003A|nr:hypothetical protein [Halobaculum rubrum]QZX99235.1 hypothetical protein K6T25_13370 [Halobaculum rubrum]
MKVVVEFSCREWFHLLDDVTNRQQCWMIRSSPESMEFCSVRRIPHYKTDPDRLAHDEYRTQLSVYYHVLASVYPDRPIQATVFYTQTATSVTVDPVSIDELGRLSRGRHH